MSEFRYQLETLHKELKEVQKTLKKAGKSRKKEDLSDIRKLISQAASVLEKSLAKIEPERFCTPGVSKEKFDDMIETAACYKCGCKHAHVVQWLSKNTGRALRKFSVVCANCWNVTVRERTVLEAIAENNNINRTFEK